MSQPVLLNSNDHKRLRIRQEAAFSKEASMRNCSVVLQEFQRLAACYPVAFTKNIETGKFTVIAVMGFDEGENLFVHKGHWQAPYLPLNIRRNPFMIGTQKTPEGDQEQVVLIDLDDERVQEQEGEPLFNEQGFPTPFLETKTSILKTMQDGLEQTAAFAERMLELDLIVPATFRVEFKNREKREIKGLYSINQDGLSALDAATAGELHAQGYLEAAYMMVASLGQMQSLIDRKNARVTE